MANPSSKLIAFRCPEELIGKVDKIARTLGTTRSAVVIEAVRLFMREIQQRGGRIVPPYEGLSLLYTMHFEPDGRGQHLHHPNNSDLPKTTLNPTSVKK